MISIYYIHHMKFGLSDIKQQLIFLYDTILEYTMCGATVLSVTTLCDSIELLFTRNDQTQKSGFETQFQVHS